MTFATLNSFDAELSSEFVTDKNVMKFGCRSVFRTLSNIYDGALLRK